jgi:hypothetical protein
MCSTFVRKEANRFYWIVKGKLIDRNWSDEDVERTYDSYMKRIWGNHENCVHEEGFEEAWAVREAEMRAEELKTVCVLGYN